MRGGKQLPTTSKGPGNTTEVLLSTGGTAMRNGTLSTLRAQQLIIEQCHVTIN